MSDAYRLAQLGQLVGAQAFWVGVDGEQNRYHSAQGQLRLVTDPNETGLEGALHTPAGPTLMGYTPMHVRIVLSRHTSQANPRMPPRIKTTLTLKMEDLDDLRTFDDAETVATDLIQHVEFVNGGVHEITTVVFRHSDMNLGRLIDSH